MDLTTPTETIPRLEMPPSLISPVLTALATFFATALNDAISKVLFIPAGAAIGTWLGALAAMLTARDDDTRAFWKDIGGVIFGAVGFGIFLYYLLRAL
jgi:hypothetical protein